MENMENFENSRSTDKQDNEKIFTQEDVDRIVSERLSRERRKKADAPSTEATEETEHVKTEKENENIQADTESAKSWNEKFNDMLNNNDYGISADDMLLTKAFNLEHNNEIDGHALAQARAQAFENRIKSGKLLEISSEKSYGKKENVFDSIMRKAFGLQTK